MKNKQNGVNIRLKIIVNISEPEDTAIETFHDETKEKL